MIRGIAMSRGCGGASLFEKKCIVNNALRRPLTGSVADIAVDCHSITTEVPIRGDFCFDTMAMRYAPVQMKHNFDLIVQQNHALQLVCDNLNKDPVPGYLQRFRLLDLVDELPESAVEQKISWLNQCNPAFRDRLEYIYDQSIYVKQSVVGKTFAEIYTEKLFVDNEEKQIDQILDDLVPVIKALQHMEFHGMVHTNLQADAIIKTQAGQIKLTHFEEVVRYFSVGERPIKQLDRMISVSESSPPEVLLGQDNCFLKLTDVWMVGMLAYFMATRGNQNPFDIPESRWGSTELRLEELRSLFRAHRLNQVPINFNYTIFLSKRGERLKNFIESCLHPSPALRAKRVVRKMLQQSVFCCEPSSDQKRRIQYALVDQDLKAVLGGKNYDPADVHAMTHNAARRYVSTYRKQGRRMARLAARPSKMNAVKTLSKTHNVLVAAAIVLAAGAVVAACVLAPPLPVIIGACAVAGVLVAGSATAAGVKVRKRYKVAKRNLKGLYQKPKAFHYTGKYRMAGLEESKAENDLVTRRCHHLSQKVSFTGIDPEDEGYDTVSMSGPDTITKDKLVVSDLDTANEYTARSCMI